MSRAPKQGKSEAQNPKTLEPNTKNLLVRLEEYQRERAEVDNLVAQIIDENERERKAH